MYRNLKATLTFAIVSVALTSVSSATDLSCYAFQRQYAKADQIIKNFRVKHIDPLKVERDNLQKQIDRLEARPPYFWNLKAAKQQRIAEVTKNMNANKVELAKLQAQKNPDGSYKKPGRVAELEAKIENQTAKLVGLNAALVEITADHQEAKTERDTQVPALKIEIAQINGEISDEKKTMFGFREDKRVAALAYEVCQRYIWAEHELDYFRNQGSYSQPFYTRPPLVLDLNFDVQISYQAGIELRPIITID